MPWLCVPVILYEHTSSWQPTYWSLMEGMVTYLMCRKGDYHRYLAEFATGNDRKEAAENSLVAYKAAQTSR